MLEKKPLIFIVDDEMIFQEILHNLLKDVYEIRTASAGVEALQKVMQVPLPDLILLDWVMPDVDGLFVCQQLKNNPLTAKIPVLFLTAKDNIEDELEGFAAGAVDYIHKPISPPILLTRVNIQLELRATQRELQQQKKDLEVLLLKRNEELEQSRALALSWFETMVFKNKNSKDLYIDSLKEHIEDYDTSELQQSLLEAEETSSALIEDDPQKQVILDQLDKIVSSKQFLPAKRMCSLLTFIVNETLDDCAKRLKAFTIAVEVFRRDKTFDPQQDPIIRVQAGNLRKRLEKYYLTEGVSDSIVIKIPKGGYSAVFTTREIV